MLESLFIQDFQNHHRTLLEFDRHVTVLGGRTGSGKTAALNALRWLCLNQPSGDKFIGDFGHADYALVRATFDGHHVYRKRSSSENAFRLGDEVYRSFGVGVPDPVVRVLNVSEFNFQGQLDQPFWLTLSPPDLSRQLNAIVNLGEIDELLDIAAKEVRQTKSEITSTSSRLAQAQERSERLSWAEEYADKVGKLEKLDQTIAQFEQDAARIASVLEGGSRAAQRLRNAAEVAKSGVGRLGEVYQEYLHQCEQLKALDSILAGIKDSEHQISMADMLIESARETVKKYTGVCPTCHRPLPNQSSSTSPTPTSMNVFQGVDVKRRTSG